MTPWKLKHNVGTFNWVPPQKNMDLIAVTVGRNKEGGLDTEAKYWKSDLISEHE